MLERRIGFVVAGDSVTIVDTTVPEDDDKPIVIEADDTWKLPNGDRAKAYDVMYRRCANYIKENKIKRAIIKASAVTMGSTKLSHLKSCELRGVIIAASASVAEVTLIAKSVISRTYGERKVDEYLQDDSFWAGMTEGGSLRKTSREAAMVVIAARNER